MADVVLIMRRCQNTHKSAQQQHICTSDDTWELALNSIVRQHTQTGAVFNNPFNNHISPQPSGMSNNPFLNQQAQPGAGTQSARSSFDSIDLAKEGQQPATAMPQQAQTTGASDFSAAQMEQDVNDQMRAWRDPEALNCFQAFDRIQEPNEKRSKRKSLLLYLIIGAIVLLVGVLAVVGAVVLSKKSNVSEVSREGAAGANVTNTKSVTQTSYLDASTSSSSSRSVTTVTQTPQVDLSPSTTTTTLSLSSSSQSVSISTTVVPSQSTKGVVVTASPSPTSNGESTTTVTEASTSWSLTTVHPPSFTSSTGPTTTQISVIVDHCTTDVCVTPASGAATPSTTTAIDSMQDRSADLVLAGYTTFKSLGLTMIEPVVSTQPSHATVTNQVTITQNQPTTTTVSLASTTTTSSPTATAKGGDITFCGVIGEPCQQKKRDLIKPEAFNGTEQVGNWTESFTGFRNGTVMFRPVRNVTDSTSLVQDVGRNASDVLEAVEVQEGDETRVGEVLRSGRMRGNLAMGVGRM